MVRAEALVGPLRIPMPICLEPYRRLLGVGCVGSCASS